MSGIRRKAEPEVAVAASVVPATSQLQKHTSCILGESFSQSAWQEHEFKNMIKKKSYPLLQNKIKNKNKARRDEPPPNAVIWYIMVNGQRESWH